MLYIVFNSTGNVGVFIFTTSKLVFLYFIYIYSFFFAQVAHKVSQVAGKSLADTRKYSQVACM